MGKRSKSAAAARRGAAPEVGEVPVVGGREPCPCGSGRRYKACHGRSAARAEHSRVLRPFAGFASEGDWVALCEMVPAATASLTMRGEHAERAVTLSTVLPMAWPAWVRPDGHVMVATQTPTSSGDVSRDVADALRRALASPPGTSVPPRPLPADAPRLADLVDVSVPLQVLVHSGFDYWLEGAEDSDDVAETTRLSLERANEAVAPTARLAGVDAGYWVRMGERTQLRWVLAEDEDAVLDAFARLQVAGELGLGEGTRYLGSFRALGLVVPVWDLPDGTEVEEVEDPAMAFGARYAEALADDSALTGDERRARHSLVARQLTVH